MSNQQPNQIIEELYLVQKKSMTDIAKVLNLKYGKVYSYLNSKNLIRRKKKCYSKTLLKKLEYLYYEERLELNKIAEILKLNNSKNVRKILLDNGFTSRPTDSEILLNKIGGEAALYELYINQNLSPSQIAKIFSSTLGRVNTLIKRFNFEKDQEMTKECWRRNTVNSFRERFNADFPFQNKKYLEEVNKVARNKYNVTLNVFQSEKIKNKSKKTLMEKYNVDHYSKTQEFKSEIKRKLRKNEFYKYSNLGKEILGDINSFKCFLENNKKKNIVCLSCLFYSLALQSLYGL